MSLYRIWKSDPNQLDDLTVDQIFSLAGTEFKDGSAASKELRQFFAEVSTEKLSRYLDQLLGCKMEKGGLVLQDLVNELGRRLEYEAENGLYQGKQGSIGFDGIWRHSDSELIIEVKTTDAYRINLDTIANYRDELIKSKRVSQSSSILFVVGRQDTGELESQVRGSRHAWGVRIISANALCKLVKLKQRAGSEAVLARIRGILKPVEFTRLDELVEILFSTAENAGAQEKMELGAEPLVVAERTSFPEKRKVIRTPEKTIDAARSALVASLGRSAGLRLIPRSRALYWSADHSLRASVAISKKYNEGYPYWYAFHDAYEQFLSGGQKSFMLLGCLDLGFGFAVPFGVLKEHLAELTTTVLPEGNKKYWHIRLIESQPGKFSILLPKASAPLPLDKYKTEILLVDNHGS